ncbi:hypothetical protein PRZ48_012087 [Zasmidium cellare]|uniref:DUF7730 domain-containing protein n=1 Tax=Zasmidium cellare TaxID=395010 RepID=A0ABR0E4S7_ZASCE|nr:hypothetical protein PRZ48_012087 [Zasmidium cellare]
METAVESSLHLEDVPPDTLDLLGEIVHALAPYLDSAEKPPLTPAKLFVIALLFNPNANLEVVMRWIFGNIPYYRNQALDDFVHDNARLYYRSSLESTRKFIQDLGNVQHQYCVPISTHTETNARGSSETTFNTTPNQARIFLKHFLASRDPIRPRKKPFPLMRLPPELRLRIYEYALTFPKSGIRIGTKRPDPTLHMATRDMHDTDDALWQPMLRRPVAFSRGPNDLIGYSLSSYLRVLLTSKQVYTEAMPVFYECNRFVCLGVPELVGFLAHTPEHRRKHIRDIAFQFEPPQHRIYNMSDITQCFSQLKRMPSLRTLILTMRQDTWATDRQRNGSLKYPDLLSLAPIKMLRSMRGLQKVEIHGGCDGVAEALIPEMTAPVPGGADQGSSKKRGGKRKAAQAVEGEDGQGARKTKKGKKSATSSGWTETLSIREGSQA